MRCEKEKEVKLIWHFLNYNKKIVSKRTDQQLEELKLDILNLIGQIKEEKEFPHNKSILCNWCEYKDICPAHQENKESNPIKTIADREKELEKYPTLSKYLKD